MTTSPGRTPTARSARWRAVVQLETAQAYGDPTYKAKSSSNCLTFGPCVSHPEEITSIAAAVSSAPRHGLAIGIIA